MTAGWMNLTWIEYVMVQTTGKLTDKELRNFGLLTGGIIAILFGLFLPWLLAVGLPYWPWVLASLLAGTALIRPGALHPVYKLWMKFGMIMHRITTPLILGILYYMVITPIGIFMRIIGHDSMARHFDKNGKTYRITSDARKPESMERPF